MRVTIIGGGVIGLSIAWELSQRGVTVTLIERGQVGCETSWAAAGILPAARCETATDPMERLRGLSHQLYPTWATELLANSGIDCGLRRCGGIYLASRSGEAAALLASLEYQHDLGLPVTSLTAAQLSSIETGLTAWASTTQFRAALLSPEEWQVRPPDLLRALHVACQQAGVQINEFTNVELLIANQQASLRRSADRFVPDPSGTVVSTVREQSGQLFHSDKLVICGGVWTGQFASGLGLGNSLIPIRGQMLMYRFTAPPLQRIVNEGHRYMVPRDDGRLLVGSCEEEVGFQIGTTDDMLASLAQWAESILPSLIDMRPERSWSALRPATYDGFPLLGKVPEVANLYVAAGHYRSGIHLAPATASVMADLLLDQTPVVDVAAFGVGRMMSTI